MPRVMASKDTVPKQFFIYPHTSALNYTYGFFFYAFGNTPPLDLLQHVPHDAERADILSLGCGDLRDLLYSIALHGRRGVSCGPVPRQLTFTLNDWEPAIHARNLVLLQLILDSRNLLKPVEKGMLDGRMEAMHIRGSSTTDEQSEEKTGETVGEMKSTANSETCSTKAGSQAGVACSEGLQAGPPCSAAFAQRIGLIFSAMYNVFVDADVLQTTQEVAGRLANAVLSPEEWNSTELGRLVHFADDRSQDRVRNILLLYADKRLQKKVSAASVEKKRSANIAKRFSTEDSLVSGAMGLASLRQKLTLEAYSDMRHKYLKEGILDPFPLLLEMHEAPLKRAECNLVNPLLLVTERKGTEFSLHYGAFPLDAFHTEVTSWKLRDESTQDEHGKLAPSVLRQRKLDTDSVKVGSTTASSLRGVQDAWFGAALEQLAQMCGGLLAATPDPHISITSAAPHLRININVGDAVDFCDSVLAASMTAGVPEGSLGPDASSSSSPTFTGIAFQQGTLQPLRLRKDTFRGLRAEFDVINTSNLADHLGTVNLLVACAPLLKQTSHAALLMSFMVLAGRLNLFKDTAALFKKVFCMSSQTAAILTGVVPVSSLSSVEGHADTTSLVLAMGSKLSSKDLKVPAGCPRVLRVTCKQPAQAFAASTSPSGHTCILADISPSEFVNLTLPVYKAMANHMPRDMPSDLTWEATLEISKEAHANSVMKYYTTASFGRLLALAGRRLRLQTEHFQAVLDILGDGSYFPSAPIGIGEQVALFHALGLAPIRNRPAHPPGIRRVVLLVPRSGLSLIRAFHNPAVCMCLSVGDDPIGDHFMSVHMAFVRVRRGRSEFEDVGNDWNSLNKHLAVRDTQEDDPDAELMVSTIVPAAWLRVMLQLAPSSMTHVQLRRQAGDAIELLQDAMGGPHQPSREVFYDADLGNVDRTAILTPDRISWARSSSSPPLVFPEQAVSSRYQEGTSVSSVTGGPSTSEIPVFQRFIHGKSHIDQSLELISQSGCEENAPMAGRVVLGMANNEAREHLANREIPHVEATRDPCSVRVVLGKELVHTARFPFPVTSKDVPVVCTKSEGSVCFTVWPLEGLLEVPFALTACDVEEDGPMTLLSTFSWPMCVPLASLPRLDFNAEWAHHEVFGPMSAHNTDQPSQENASRRSAGGAHLGFRGMKESLLDIATTACATHEEGTPIWKRSWVCITSDQRLDKPVVWVWVNEILLDSSNQALVLDCCIMPAENLGQDSSLQLGAAVGVTSTHFIQVCQKEFELWMALLPVAVERARQTYAHTTDCIYSIPSDAIPISASPSICICGMGKDLPSAFMESMKSVNAMVGGAPLTALVYRAALSPLYAPPEAVAVPRAGVGVGCAKCGKGGSSMRCSRCRKVRYCSKQCQRQDWEKHKSMCAAFSAGGAT